MRFTLSEADLIDNNTNKPVNIIKPDNADIFVSPAERANIWRTLPFLTDDLIPALRTASRAHFALINNILEEEREDEAGTDTVTREFLQHSTSQPSPGYPEARLPILTAEECHELAEREREHFGATYLTTDADLLYDQAEQEADDDAEDDARTFAEVVPKLWLTLALLTFQDRDAQLARMRINSMQSEDPILLDIYKHLLQLHLKTRQVGGDEQILGDLLDLLATLLDNSSRYRTLEPIRALSHRCQFNFAGAEEYERDIAVSLEDWFQCGFIDHEFFNELDDNKWRLRSGLNRADVASQLSVHVKELTKRACDMYETFTNN
jgi:hypothetical protein